MHSSTALCKCRSVKFEIIQFKVRSLQKFKCWSVKGSVWTLLCQCYCTYRSVQTDWNGPVVVSIVRRIEGEIMANDHEIPPVGFARAQRSCEMCHYNDSSKFELMRPGRQCNTGSEVERKRTPTGELGNPHELESQRESQKTPTWEPGKINFLRVLWSRNLYAMYSDEGDHYAFYPYIRTSPVFQYMFLLMW